MNAGTPAIEAVGLTRRCGEAIVLDLKNLQVGQGEAVALLGPNGAGKTTMVNILSTLIKPTAGTGRVLGHDVVHEADAVRRLIGVTGQFSAVDVLLTTQCLHEADELADRVVVLDGGRIVADGTPDALKRQVPGGHVRVAFNSDERLAAAASALGSQADPEHRALTIPVDGSITSLRGALDRLTPHESAVTDITVHRPDLDDVFLALTTRDTATMLRRNLRHIQRYPSLTLMLLAQPVLILLLFVFVFGETLGAGVRPDLAGAGRAAYLEYVVPGILLFAIAGVGLGTAISVAADRTKGIMSRFRAMD